MSSDRGRRESVIWSLSTILKGLIHSFSGQEPILNVFLPLVVARDYWFLKIPVYRVYSRPAKWWYILLIPLWLPSWDYLIPWRLSSGVCVCVCVCVCWVLGSGESLAHSLFLTPTILKILSLTFITYSVQSFTHLVPCLLQKTTRWSPGLQSSLISSEENQGKSDRNRAFEVGKTGFWARYLESENSGFQGQREPNKEGQWQQQWRKQTCQI